MMMMVMKMSMMMNINLVEANISEAKGKDSPLQLCNGVIVSHVNIMKSA